MKLTVFGNNATCPEAGGACACFLVETEGKRILLDMGCGSLPRLQCQVDLAKLDLIVISHLHFDHFGDLFCAKYQLETRAARGEKLRSITLCSPALPDWAAGELLSNGVFSHMTVADGGEYRLGPVELTFFRVPHLVESYAVRLRAEDKIFTYSGDSAACDALTQAARGADCFLCEASLVDGQQSEAGHHLLAQQAGRIAAEAGAGQLLLTHYHSADSRQVLAQAGKQFPVARLTRIGDSVMI